jgi:hypothetical protein
MPNSEHYRVVYNRNIAVHRRIFWSFVAAPFESISHDYRVFFEVDFLTNVKLSKKVETSQIYGKIN